MFINFGDFHVVGASPEILVRVFAWTRLRFVRRGTAVVGAPREKRALEARLLATRKSWPEHLMLLIWAANRLRAASLKSAPCAKPKNSSSNAIATVMHIGFQCPWGACVKIRDAWTPFSLPGCSGHRIRGPKSPRDGDYRRALSPRKRALLARCRILQRGQGDMDMCIAASDCRRDQR